MPKYSAAINSPFTIDQLAEAYKTAFDALGWGTGKVNIQGGYRFTAQQAADAAASPVVVRPDGTVSAPASIPNLTACTWVDNFCGKNLVYPTQDTYLRWPLLFWMPGLKAFRLRFTPLYRPGGGSTGNFSDIAFHVVEATFNNNPTNVSNQGRAASLNDSWGTTYTVGQQYVTRWSHGSGGAFADSAQIATAALVYCQNVVLRIDAIECLLDEKAFGVQSPLLDGPVHEFRFLDGGGAAYACMRPIPAKDAYRPRVALLPPLLMNDTGFGSMGQWVLTRYANLLFNAYRDDNLQEAGLCGATVPTFAVLKNYTYGSTVNLFAASNPDFKGFFLRTTQSGKTTFQLACDRAAKSFLPAPTTLTERRERARSYADDDAVSTTRAPQRVGWLFRVEGQRRTLSGVGVENLYGAGTNTYAFRLYRVTPQGGGLVYEAKVADLTLTGNNLAGTSAAYSAGLSLGLDPGYYLLVPPSNLPVRAHRKVPDAQHPVVGAARLLGPVACRDLSSDAGWTPGQTVLSLGADLSLVGNNAPLHGDLMLWLDFDTTETPAPTYSAFAEGVVYVCYSPGPSGGANNLDYDALNLDNSNGGAQGSWCYGAYPAFGLGRALACVEPGAVWQISPLPGWFASARGTGGSNNPQVEFAPDVSSPFPGWLDRPWRTSFPLGTLRLRNEASVAAGGSYVNADGSEDLVFSRHIYNANANQQRSLCFRLLP